MSTEICINLNDELSNTLGDYSGLASQGFSGLSFNEKSLLRKAFNGNVNKEYEFVAARLTPDYYASIRNKIGSKTLSAMEAALDHSAMANVPRALILAAYVNYFGGIATPPSKVKEKFYSARSILQGYYETVGILHDRNRKALNPIAAAYHLEQLLNSDDTNIYDQFRESCQNDVNASENVLIKNLLKKISSEMDPDKRLFIKKHEKLINNYAQQFNIAGSYLSGNNRQSKDNVQKQLCQFAGILRLIIGQRERFVSASSIELSETLTDIKKEIIFETETFDILYRGMEIVFSRFYLERFTGTEIKNDTSTLKDTVIRVISDFIDDSENSLYQHSPYVARLVALYDIKFFHTDKYEKLNQTLEDCKDREFRDIAKKLRIEKLVVDSVSSLNRKNDKEGVCWFEDCQFGFNTVALNLYITATFFSLYHQLNSITEYISAHTREAGFDSVSGIDGFHKECVKLISSCVDLDPVLAYNDCEYSHAISDLIRYLVDKTGLPPQMISHIEKEAPYYGYTKTTAANLYLGNKSKTRYPIEFGKIDKEEQKISQLKAHLVAETFNSNIESFESLKDSPSQNFDYLLKEYLYAILCILEESSGDLTTMNYYSTGVCKLFRILYDRGRIQLGDYGAQQSDGIAIDCLNEILRQPQFREVIGHLSCKYEYDKDFQRLKRQLMNYYYDEKPPKYPVPADYMYLSGDTRGTCCAKEDLELVSSVIQSHWIGDATDKFSQFISKEIILYSKNLLAYDLCCPHPSNKGLFKLVEDKYGVKPYKTSQTMSRKDIKEAGNRAAYSCGTIDNALHILGNHRLSEVLEKKIITQLKADKKKLQKYGFKMVPNFILYGESGTGKTQAVKAFCEHLGLKVLEINSATIGATCIHETPMKINKIFEEAFEEEKAVIVIDEADAFLCERSNLSSNAEYRVEEVNAFLQCIDKAVENHTLVISITNYLNRIDSAILRSGRLGVHIEVKNPDEQDIEEVIESCFDNTEHEEFDLHKLSKALTGQNLANIFAILNEVKIDALMEDETITQNMLMDKINRTQGYTLKAGAHFELPGQKVFEDYVNENIVDHLSNPEYYRRFNLKFPNSILLYGPTGTGKTFCARKLADFLGWKFYQLDSKNIGSESVNGSAMKIADIFKKARNEAPCIIFIDEIDAWLPKRSMFISGSEVSQVNEFLSNMSQLNSDNLLLIGTTNRLDDIDEAALRNGRFSAKIEIGYMRTEQIADLLENLLADIPHDETVDVSEIAEKLDNKSAADVVACFEKACRYGAINKYESLTSECFTKTMEITPKKEHKVQRLGFI